MTILQDLGVQGTLFRAVTSIVPEISFRGVVVQGILFRGVVVQGTLCRVVEGCQGWLLKDRHVLAGDSLQRESKRLWASGVESP